jgi:serine/threonine-protein kinase HipA
MKTGPLETVFVYADLERFERPALMGSLRRQSSRTEDIFSFEYEPTWLHTPEAFSCDPDLALVKGPQNPVAGRPNFGIFLDSSPIAGVAY